MKRSVEEVRRALHSLTTYDRARYFYERLKDPDWFDALKELRAFSPPKPTSAEPSPPWPSAIYLKKMAGVKPEKVVEVAAEVKGETLTTRRELLEISLILPSLHARRLMEQAAKWPDEAFGGFWLGSLFEGVVKHLLQDRGGVGVATKIVQRLITLRPKKPEHEYTIEAFNRDKAVPIVGEDAYEFALRSVSALSAGNPTAALQLVVQELKRAIEIERGLDSSRDYSAIWLKDLASGPTYDAKAKLGRLSYELSLQIAAQSAEKLAEVLQILRKVNGTELFTRVRLAIITASNTIDFARAEMDNFADADFSAVPEWKKFLSTFYGAFTLEERQKIIAILERFMDSSRYVSWAIREFGETPNEKQIAAFESEVTLEALEPIHEFLEGDLLARYSAAKSSQAVKAPRRAPTSEELLALSVSRVIETLAGMAESEIGLESSIGYDHNFQFLASSRPAQWLAELPRILKLPPRELGSVLYGLFQALRARADEMPTTGLIELTCRAIVERENSLAESEYVRPVALLVIGDLLTTERAPEDVANLAQAAWHALDDNSPDRERNAQWKPINASSASMNTVRGAAASVLVRAYMVARELNMDAEFLEFTNRAIRRISQDSSPLVRVTLAQRFSVFRHYDPALAAALVNPIFRSGNESIDRSSWFAYVTWRPINAQDLELLRPIYAERLVEFSEPIEHDRDVEQLRGHVAQGIWFPYAFGHEELREPSALLEIFLDHAQPPQLADLILGSGDALVRGDLSTEQIERLVILWDYLVGERFNKASEARTQLMIAFGAWFASPALQPSWALDRLQAVLRVTNGDIDREFQILPRLVALASTNLDEVAFCIRLIVRSPRHSVLSAIAEHAEPIFAAAKTATPPARKALREANDVLMANNYHNFRKYFLTVE